MRDFQQKKRWRSVLESWPVLILLALLLLFFAWGIVSLFSRMQTTRENKQLAEKKLIELQKKKETFTGDVEKLNTQSGIEETIREKFPVVKEGEGLVIVVEDKNKPEEIKEEEGGILSYLYFWRWFK
jgi:cell division protein FtsB